MPFRAKAFLETGRTGKWTTPDEQVIDIFRLRPKKRKISDKSIVPPTTNGRAKELYINVALLQKKWQKVTKVKESCQDWSESRPNNLIGKS
jgi:hypothetical protein